MLVYLGKVTWVSHLHVQGHVGGSGVRSLCDLLRCCRAVKCGHGVIFMLRYLFSTCCYVPVNKTVRLSKRLVKDIGFSRIIYCYYLFIYFNSYAQIAFEFCRDLADQQLTEMMRHAADITRIMERPSYLETFRREPLVLVSLSYARYQKLRISWYLSLYHTQGTRNYGFTVFKVMFYRA